MEALQEAAEECQHIFRDVLSPAGAEAETVVDHSWRCVHALARFPSASILKQVVSVALVTPKVIVYMYLSTWIDYPLN